MKTFYLEASDLAIIRNFLKSKLPALYSHEWSDETCVSEMVNWMYYNA